MPEFIRKNLGEQLIEQGLITDEQFQTALKRHKETKVQLRQILVELGFISEEKLTEFQAALLNIPFLRDLPSAAKDPDVARLVPEKDCRKLKVFPLEKAGGELTLAMADPFDVFAIDDLKAMTQCKIRPVLALPGEITRTIDLYFKAEEPLEEMVQGMAKEAEELEIIRESQEEENSEDLAEAEDAPIIRLVNTIITQAIQQRASDVHLEPDDKTLRIRYRIDGILQEAMLPPKRLQAPITSRIKIMAGMDISVKRTPQDGRFKIRVENKDFDVRISSVPTIYGEKVVMRLLDQSSVRMGLDEAGFSAGEIARFSEMIKRPYGIILVTGPTGSGKTTTLYLALQSINSPDKNIITIEDPVEYDLTGINQISVNVKAGVTFAHGLRSILRQDPDVIMVGEMRDLETADVAVRAALTGHLVFSTLHTNDAASSIVRMIDMGLPSYLVTSAVCCVLAQRLVRVICPACRETYAPTAAELSDAGLSGAENLRECFRGRGCEACNQTGYQGRTGLFEMMVVDKDLRNLIHNGGSEDALREAACRGGMKTLWEDGMDKIRGGVTTLEEMKRVTFKEDA